MITEFIRDFDADKYLEWYCKTTTSKDRSGMLTTLQCISVKVAEEIFADGNLTEIEKRNEIDCVKAIAIDLANEIKEEKNVNRVAISAQDHATMSKIVDFEVTARQLDITERLAKKNWMPSYRVLLEHYNDLLDHELPLYQPIESMILHNQLYDDWRAVARYIGLIKFMKYLDGMVQKAANKPQQTSQMPREYSLRSELTSEYIARIYTKLNGVFTASIEQWRALFSDPITLQIPIKTRYISDVAILFKVLHDIELIRTRNYPSILEAVRAFEYEGKILTATQINKVAENPKFPEAIRGANDILDVIK